MKPAPKKSPPRTPPKRLGQPRVSNAMRNAATRSALVDAGRDLFGERGYSAVGTEEIVRAAGVTRGAMYHHFKSKRALFREVYDDVEQEMVAHVAGALETNAGRGDSWDAARIGVRAYLEYCADAAVERIAILDAPSVLDTEVRREIANERGGMLVRATIQALIADGKIKPQPVDALAQLLIGALVEGATYAAEAEKPARARDEVLDLIEKMLRGLA